MDFQKTIKGYADGIAVTVAVYFLSPPSDALRNAIVVGAIHGALHHTAAQFLIQGK